MPQPIDFKSIDPIIHAPARMAIMAILIQTDEVDYTFLSEELGLTDGNLTTHMKKLEENGYVRCNKGFIGRKPRTSYRVTAKGRAAFERYLDALEAVVDRTRK
jgi:DNA-binding MarR family transcriptional regulator